MAMLTIIIGGICVAYLVIAQVLEWMHHMAAIKQNWPRAYKTLMNPGIRVLLLLVAIGLFAEVLRERRPESKSSPVAPAVAPKIDQSATNSTCANFVAGQNSKIDCSPSTKNDSATKSASEKH